MSSADLRFQRLYERHGGAVRDYFARRIEHRAVDDAVAETFAVAWRKLDRVPLDHDEAIVWLLAVAHGVAQHQWRSAGRWQRLNDRIAVTGVTDRADGADVSDDVVEVEERRLVLRAAAELADDDREILLLTVWDELPLGRAAAVLGISAAAARQRAHRARRRLGKAYRRLEAEGVPTARAGGGAS